MTPESLMPVALEAVDLAHDLIKTMAPGALTPKGDRDMASDVDFAVERRLREFLGQRTPSIAFYGEEEGRQGPGRPDLEWVLDPVDGTVNFIRTIPLCAVSLALLRRGEPVLGVVDLPFLDSRYSAVLGGGTHLHGRRLRIEAGRPLKEVVVAMGDFAVGVNAVEKNRLRFKVAELLASTALRVRMVGSAAVDLAWVAEGKIDASIMLSNNPWDTAAGVLLAREAGARVVDADCSEHRIDSRATLASAPGVVEDVLAIVQQAHRQLSEKV
jgi:myo-inositol-1(or 4)-monophosphatase